MIDANAVQKAIDSATAKSEAHMQKTLDAGGACDFCAQPSPFDTLPKFPHADELLPGGWVTWVTDRPVKLTMLGITGDDVGQKSLDYGTSWLCCPDCDLEVAKRDPAGLAAFVMPRRPDEIRRPDWRAKMTPDEIAEVDAEAERNLVILYREFYAAGAHRFEPLRTANAKLPVKSDSVAGRWKDAYEKQMDLWNFTRHPVGKALLRGWVELETRKQPTKKIVYDQLLAAEESKLLTSPPVYVTDEMCDLIDQARQTFRPETVLHQDLMLDRAFLYFARPIYIQDRRGNTVNIQAICYCPIRADVGALPEGDGQTAHEGIAISFYSGLGAPDDLLTPDLRAKRDDVVAKFGVYYDLQILHCAPLWFNVDPSGEEIDVDTGGETGFSEWWSLLQVTFRMMLERVADPHQRQLDRHTRKHSRKGFDPRDVIVIRLRRPKNDKPTETERDVDWTHRWLVTGHWRNQWYPTLGMHRQRWISGYVKGPDDKPLVVKKKVYEWNR